MLQTMLKRASYSIRLVYPYKPTLLVSLFFDLIYMYCVLSYCLLYLICTLYILFIYLLFLFSV